MRSKVPTLKEIADGLQLSCGKDTAEAGAYLIDAYFRQMDLFIKLHEKETRLGQIIDEASKAFELENGHPPITQAEKKQALLNHIIAEGGAQSL